MLLDNYKTVQNLLDYLDLSSEEEYALGCWLGSKESINKTQYLADIDVIVGKDFEGNIFSVEAEQATEDYMTYNKQAKLIKSWAGKSGNEVYDLAEDYTFAQDEYLHELALDEERAANEMWEEAQAELNSDYMRAVL